MLKGIPSIISPELLKILMEMGHGDEIVIGDGNFPAASMAKKLIRCDGHSVPDLLSAILKLFPLDTFVEKPIALMEVVDKNAETPKIWNEFKNILDKYEPENNDIEYIERFSFYERAKNAYAIIATGEKAIYANIILKKGIL